MEKILSAIQGNLKTAYQQAVDADQKLDGLSANGHGKFTQIFNEQSVFSSKEKRFMPYVQEMGRDFDALSDNGQIDQQQLSLLVKKLEAFFTTVQQLNQSMKKRR